MIFSPHYQDRLLRGCPRIGILFKIEELLKNKHSHICDIGVYAYLRVLFFVILKSLGKRAFSDRLLLSGIDTGLLYCLFFLSGSNENILRTYQFFQEYMLETIFQISFH